MADVITLTSSEDESSTPSPPRKRIKPTTLPQINNLPQISITKVTQKKKQAVVVLCSDDDDDDELEEIAFVPSENKSELKNNTNNEENKKPVSSVQNNTVGIIDDKNSDIVEVKNAQNHVDRDFIKDLEDSCEIIDADSCEESSGKENRTVSKDDCQPECSSAVAKSSNAILLDKFIKIIDDQTNEDKYKIVKSKFEQLRQYFNGNHDLAESTNFKNMLLSNIQQGEKSATTAVYSFNEIYQYLKDISKADTIEVDKNTLTDLKRLEKNMKRVLARIKKIEEEEIDFDEEEDSSYMKLDKYVDRLDKLNKKYCKLLKKNPFCGRIIYSKLDFVDSEFNEINRAISKKYKNNNTFPSYYEMQNFIKKVNKDENLGLNESKIKNESARCFKKLGELLQIRRRKDLYDSHYLLIKDSEDPAKEDQQLNETLKKSYLEGQSKIEKVVQEYVTKQDTKGDDPELNQSGDDVDNDDDEDKGNEDKDVEDKDDSENSNSSGSENEEDKKKDK